MGFKKRSSFINTVKGDNPSTSNPGIERNSDDAKLIKHSTPNKNVLIQKKLRNGSEYVNDRCKTVLFRRDMPEKTVRKELFMLECDDIYEGMSLRAKMCEIVKRSSEEFKTIFYDMGASAELPNNIEEFKEMLVDFCTNQGIDSIRKYSDEKWSGYFIRLREFGKHNSVQEGKILKKLRSEFLPKHLQTICYFPEITLNFLIERTREYESYSAESNYKNKFEEPHKESRIKSKINNNSVKCYICSEVGHIASKCSKKIKNMVQCYKCKAYGHISYNCTKKDVANSVAVCRTDVDERIITIQNIPYKAIFDTGASANMICSGALSKLRGIKIDPVVKEYSYFDGGTNKTCGVVRLEFQYNKNIYNKEFNVVDAPGRIDILIANVLVQDILGKQKSIPIECSIDTGDAPAVNWTRPIVGQKNREDFEVLVEQMEKNGIIEPSTSSWLNPVVITRKKNGKIRFCVDFRRLNDLVSLDEFEVPRIAEILASLRDQRYFSTLDLEDGFFQIPIKSEHKEKTTFYTGRRLMQFTRMPQGFKNSPAIFQRAMTLVFSEVIGKKCLIYIDDILVFGKTREEHDRNLEEILSIMKSYGLRENKEKRKSCLEEICFLGYRIEMNKLKPDLNRTQGIVDYTMPKNKKALQRFLGIINYDRMFVKNITELLSPLYELLKKEKKFEWQQKHTDAVNTIKKKWKETLELRIADMNVEFEVETDASNVGIGAVLKQKNEAIAYASRSLSTAETKYSITEKEVLAVVWAIDKFRYYLTGRRFKLTTDHKALEELKNKKDFGSYRVHRWYERLARQDFYVSYKRGEDLVQADALSRSLNNANNAIELKNEDKIMKTHREYNHRKTLKAALEKNGIAVKEDEVREVLKNCEVCQKKDKGTNKTCCYVETKSPGERVGFDLLDLGSRGKVILGIDYFSRFVYGKTLKTKEPYKVVQFLEEMYSKFPFKTMITDNGREFDNSKVKDWAMKNKIEHKFSIPYYHKSNGRIERVNRTIRHAFRKTRGNSNTTLQKILDNYNNIIHRGLGMSPSEALNKENQERVLKKAEEYKKEFSKGLKKVVKLQIGDMVLIKNELKNTKMEDEFNKEGKIVENEYGDVYLVKLRSKNETIRRHISQLKKV